MARPSEPKDAPRGSSARWARGSSPPRPGRTAGASPTRRSCPGASASSSPYRCVADATELSGGERQLVAVARALASDQPVLLLDEPTSGLDPNARTKLLAALGSLRRRRTLVIVTHRAEPLAIADRVVRIGGSPHEPLEPASLGASAPT